MSVVVPRTGAEVGVVTPGEVVDEDEDGGRSQGEASSWAAIVSSMLASPQGASEQYMCRVTPSLIAKGWGEEGEMAEGGRLVMMFEVGELPCEWASHSSRR